jgi:AcrR family transcriptional regulator
MPDAANQETSADNLSRTQAERTRLAETRMVLAAIELLNTVGVKGTTLVAIGDKSGYSRGLATHHFGSKAGLFRTVLKRISEAWSKKLGEQLDGKTGLDAVEIAIDTHLEFVLAHPEYMRVQYMLWGAAIDPSTEFKPNVAEFMQIQRESVASWVTAGQAEGEIRKELNPDRLAEQYYGALIGINKQWQVSPDFDLPAAYADFKQNFVRQLRTQ